MGQTCICIVETLYQGFNVNELTLQLYPSDTQYTKTGLLVLLSVRLCALLVPVLLLRFPAETTNENGLACSLDVGGVDFGVHYIQPILQFVQKTVLLSVLWTAEFVTHRY